MSQVNLVQNDTNPRVTFTVTYDSDSSPVNLTGATVNFVFKKAGSNTYVFKRECSIASGMAASGQCYYDWQEDDLDDEGHYEGELEVIFPGDAVQTTAQKIPFFVRPELG